MRGKQAVSKKSTVPVDPLSTLSDSISSPDRLSKLLEETETELAQLQPEIDSLEATLGKLQTLRQTKQKLITLKLSIQSILENFSGEKEGTISLSPSLEIPSVFVSGRNRGSSITPSLPNLPNASAVFFPDLAFQGVAPILRRKNTINYEIYKAIVLRGGRATTEEVKQSLVEQGITLPGDGRSFSEVPLTDVSSRINYLVRKQVLRTSPEGYFVTVHGWQDTQL